MFTDHFIANLLLILSVKEFWQLDNIGHASTVCEQGAW